MRPAPNLKVKTRRRSRGEILGSWHLCQFLTPLPLYIPALQLSWFLGPRAIHVVVQRSSLSICSARLREGGWQQKVVATTREIVCFQRVPKTIRKPVVVDTYRSKSHKKKQPFLRRATANLYKAVPRTLYRNH